MGVLEYLSESESLLAATREHPSVLRVENAVEVITQALASGRPLLVCGNGGSAADAMHISGELVGRFHRERRGFKCICLVTDPAFLTAWANDYSYDSVFARQIEAYGHEGGVLLGLSTSGNSANVVRAFEAARLAGMSTIAFTGAGGGKLASLADVLVDVPSRSTPLIQQVHSCLYHYLCAEVEERLADQPA
ncbi:MAG TPA: SIS domain-containing protein [Acidimicrobiales bacterium]|nr:SIS domain-containing protein [Acidimicrobiales bacterium]